MTRLELAKQKFPYLFKKQICSICGKEFYFNNIQILCRLSRLLQNKPILIACCSSHIRKLQMQSLGSPFSNKICINKSRETKLKRYGNINYNNRDKAKKTCDFKYGVSNPSQIKEVLHKIKKSKLTNIDKMGLNSYQRASIKITKKRKNNIDNNGLNSYQKGGLKAKQTLLSDIDSNGLNGYERIVQKSKQTKLTKYGDKNYNNLNKIYQTNLIKIGVKTPMESKIVINNYKKKYKQKTGYNFPFENPLVIEKIYQTNIKNLGVSNPFKSNIIKQKIKDKEQEIKIKRYKTMKINKTYNRYSKPEDNCYNLLLSKFLKEDIERPYMSKYYPFKCDFYIKSLNLYIECHFS